MYQILTFFLKFPGGHSITDPPDPDPEQGKNTGKYLYFRQLARF